MLPHGLYEDLKKLLAQQFGQGNGNLHAQPVGGGSINQTYKVTFSNTHTCFCKINAAAKFPNLFLTEKQGLEALRKTGAIKTPGVVAYAILEEYQVLLLDWIESGPKTQTFFKMFGEQLAALHYHSAAQFGWNCNNYMGSVPQENGFQENWISFFIEQRLEPLVHQCLALNLLTETEHGHLKKLYQKLPQFFDAAERPALLHGDLWSGNFMCTEMGQPVLIDPAVCYGHRCMDLAMTTLFGGFDKSFYDAYHYHFPLPALYTDLLSICNLYPLLIHLRLFGRSYLTSIQQTLQRFV